MANGKDLELALRIKADLSQGLEALGALKETVQNVGTSASDTSTKIDDVSKAAVEAATTTATANDAVTASEARLAAAIRAANTELGRRPAPTSSPQGGESAPIITPVINKAPVVELTEATQTLTSTAKEASAEFGHVGETAEQQTARIKAVVAASIAQKEAQDAVTAGMQRQEAGAKSLSANWQATVAAQNASMNAYHASEKAAQELAASEQHVAEETAKATAESARQEAALGKLLSSIDSNERALSRLDQQERELTDHYKAGRLSLEQYTASLDKLKTKRSAVTDIATDAKTSGVALGGLADSIRSVQRLLLTGFAGYGLTSASRAIVDTNLAWQQALYTMEAATGSSAKARQELEYVRDVSERLGLELLSTSQSYARLVAAAKETPALGASLHSIFEGVSSAATTLHLTKEETNGLLLALEQMVSKGKVQTQELVLQLGQRVPGAFALAAKALGTNTAQLNTWLEKGMIPAADFLPRFGAALQEAYGPSAQKAAGGLNAEINRLTNAFTQLKIEAGEAGFISSYTNAIRDLQGILKDPAVKDGLNTLIQALGKLIELATRGAAGTVNVIKYAAEEFASRVSGPAGDDTVRINDAIDRESQYMTRLQAALDKAYDENDTKRAARMEDALDRAQQQIQKWQEMLKSNEASGNAIQLPATPVTAAATTAPFKPTDDGKATARLLKQNEDWVKQLEKEASTYGKGKAALREYELDQRNLTGSLEARARAAWATLDTAEKQRKADDQAAKDVKTLTQLRLDYLKSTGNDVEAAGAEIQKKYGALQKRLLASGNTEGAGLVDKLINVDKAKAELDQLGKQVDAVFSDQSRREQTINTQQQAGLISELGAQQQILDLNKLTADEIEKLLPKMQELADVTGDPAAIERVKDLQARLNDLRTVADKFANSIKAGFENGIQNALQGLATGTLNLKEAALGFVRDIASSLSNLASQTLAKLATDSLSDLFSSGSKAAVDTAGDAARAAAITSASAVGATAMGAAITTAGFTAASAMSAAIATASAGSSAAGGAGGLLSLFGGSGAGGAAAAGGASTYTGAFGFADGGQVLGEGTSTSDSIRAWLSDKEFITRAAVVTQPGALPFLHDFNSRGMAAIDDWAKAVRHNTGGLAGVPALAMPFPSMGSGTLSEPAKAMSATLKNSQNFYLVDDPSRIADSAFNTPQGVEAMVIAISKDPDRFRSVLNIG